MTRQWQTGSGSGRLFGAQDLNQRAQAETTVREALRELDMWGAAAEFQLTSYEAVGSKPVPLIREWREVVSQVRSNPSCPL